MSASHCGRLLWVDGSGASCIIVQAMARIGTICSGRDPKCSYRGKRKLRQGTSWRIRPVEDFVRLAFQLQPRALPIRNRRIGPYSKFSELILTGGNDSHSPRTLR